MEKIIVCTYDEGLLPEKKTLGAVCRDLKLAEDFSVKPGNLQVVGTGIKTYIPHGRHAKVYARSGLPVKMGLILANSVAVFDADYRGEYMMQMYNFGSQELSYPKYTRVTQLEFLPYYSESGKFGLEYVPEIEFVVDQKLYESFEEKFSSVRGAGRFNSTGV